ncbi:MAG: hypothetical protein NTV82_03160 [Candidatus Aminicenantes bacterium]|nr:hypothetical protein [Candidatus Aminicenantes bacterium]
MIGTKRVMMAGLIIVLSLAWGPADSFSQAGIPQQPNLVSGLQKRGSTAACNIFKGCRGW